MITFDLMNILFLIFLILKITKNISWSWWWVTAPIWMPILLDIMYAILLSF
jgi:hypothetical protein